MIIRNNLNISNISWLSSLNGGGQISTFYQPETTEELSKLCRGFFAEGRDFDLIGHTSNTLYLPDYNCELMVSTRKLNKFEIRKNEIECESGTSVRQLSIAAIEEGIKGFEGLIDLPGTVAASLYGNAGCYGCSISSMLKQAVILTNEGVVEEVGPEWFCFTERSSVLKRREKRAIILSVTLCRSNGEKEELKAIAEHNHATRKATQPEAKNSLGSIFAYSGKATILNRSISAVTKLYAIALRMFGEKKENIELKRKHLTFVLLGATDIEPYVKHWNWYQWCDEKSYSLFWKYVRLHRRMFTKSEFEIEIKHNPNFKIP